jgi:hypothetical protein
MGMRFKDHLCVWRLGRTVADRMDDSVDDRYWPVRDSPAEAENVWLLGKTGSSRHQIDTTAHDPNRAAGD